MRNLSLRLRSFAAAILTLLIFIPLAVITLEQAFNNSLSQSMQQQLKVQNLTLISEFEFEDNHAVMPELLFNDQLNVPDAGLYAFVLSGKQIVWKSQSTLNWQQLPALTPPPIGEENFIEDYDFVNNYFLFAYTAEFEAEQGYQPVSFFVLQDKRIFNAEKDKFANTLWYWLSLIALLLLVLLLISLNAALLPISRLNRQIKQAESGQLKRIDQQYPPELDKLKLSINNLLNSEELQRSRYKNSLSDLAHSLKTPLAVLAGNDKLPEDAREPVQQINQLIQRQLKRAVVGGHSGWDQAVAIKPVVIKLVNAMQKVYMEKNLDFSIEEVDVDTYFQGDITDLMEILGNIIDNACKAANHKIILKCTMTTNWLQLCVEDDGPGIPAEKRLLLLERGIRLDSYTEGHGIGMAVVADLVSAYQGQLHIETSDLGGALILLKFHLK